MRKINCSKLIDFLLFLSFSRVYHLSEPFDRRLLLLLDRNSYLQQSREINPKLINSLLGRLTFFFPRLFCRGTIIFFVYRCLVLKVRFRITWWRGWRVDCPDCHLRFVEVLLLVWPWDVDVMITEDFWVDADVWLFLMRERN